MNSQEFVEALKLHVRDAAVEDTIKNLKNPPGRRVQVEERARSDWYNNLSAAEASHVDAVIAAAVHEAVFGLLAVLDGARTIEGTGRLELAYVDGHRVLLNDPQAISLHELLNATD